MSDLRDNVVFITGSGSGLGLALVRRFIEEGARVATLELSAAKVAYLRQRFGEHVLAVEGMSPATPTISARWITFSRDTVRSIALSAMREFGIITPRW